MKKNILIIIVIVGGLVGASFFFSHPESIQKEEQNRENTNNIQLSTNLVDFGDIKQEDGSVSVAITVSNTGTEILKLNRLSTSCGCTSAEMDMSDMTAGESRDMLITFDPLVHLDQFGPIIRVVYLQTSDPIQSEVEIDVVGNVIK